MLSERSESGLAGIRHNGVDYLVRKNVFGDITHLYAPDGGVAARYDYDAWGNPRIAVSGGHRVGELNPFLYRGYCYDRETGYYYLRTRYYDPEACRFLSPDDPSLLLLTGDHANGIMSYTYCADNPVMDVDDDGQMPKWLRVLLGVVIIAAAVGLSFVTAGLAAPIATSVGGGLFGAVVSGAVTGAIGGAITGFGLSIGIQGVSQGFDNIDWGQVGKATWTGAVSGFIAGGVFGGIKYIRSSAKIANSLSGLKEAQSNLDKATLALKMTPLIEKGASMAMHEVAYNISKLAIESLNHAQKIFDITNFAIRYLYKFGQFGLKQLIGYGIEGWI